MTINKQQVSLLTQVWYRRLIYTLFRRVLKPFSRHSRRVFEFKKIKQAYGVAVLSLSISAATFPGTLLAAQTNKAIAIQPQMVVAPITTEKSVRIPVERYLITQRFSFFHPGIDMASDAGSPIYPIMNGIVSEVIRDRFGYGNHIIIDHGSGLLSLYAHLATITVQKGDSVSRLAQIGTVGSTGHSTGPHLHLQIWQNDQWTNPQRFLEDYLEIKLETSLKNYSQEKEQSTTPEKLVMVGREF